MSLSINSMLSVISSSPLHVGRTRLQGSKSFGRGWSSHCSCGNAYSFWSTHKIVLRIIGLLLSPNWTIYHHKSHTELNSCSNYDNSISICLTQSLTCGWTRLPRAQPPISWTRLVITFSCDFVRSLICRICPAELVINDSFVAFVTDSESVLDSTPACLRARCEVWQLPMISSIFCLICRERILEMNAKILVFPFEHDLIRWREIEETHWDSWKLNLNGNVKKSLRIMRYPL